MKKLSIIVPCFNSESTIHRCVSSILQNSYDNIEVILINDGSSDNTYKIIKELERNDSHIHSFSKSNEGLGITRNFGIKKATGEYITFIDSDDYVDKDVYLKLITKMEEDASDVAFCGFKYTNGLRTWVDDFNCLELYNNPTDFIRYILNPNPCFAGISVCTGLYKRELISSMGDDLFFEEQKYLSEDKLFNIRYLTLTKRVSIIPESLYYYVQHQSGTITTSFKEYKIEAAYNLCDYLRNFFSDQVLEKYVLIDYLVNLSACLQQIYSDNSIDKHHKGRFLNRVLDDKFVEPLKQLDVNDINSTKFKMLYHLIMKQQRTIIRMLFIINAFRISCRKRK